MSYKTASKEEGMIFYTEDVAITLLDHLGGDLSVVNAARVSFNTAHDTLEENDDKLIYYLMRERHGSPFEHNIFKFLVEVPLFVRSEHHRHRVGHSYNEMSGRYTEMQPIFYYPKNNVRKRVGKPGHYNYEPVNEDLEFWYIDELMEQCERAWNIYLKAIEKGIAPEVARMHLPLNICTKYYWTCNARSLMHFLSLRNAPNALYEIRKVAQLAEIGFKQHMPITYNAFVKHGRVAP